MGQNKVAYQNQLLSGGGLKVYVGELVVAQLITLSIPTRVEVEFVVGL